MKKTLALWLVLIVAFVAFYRFFATQPGAGTARPRDADASSFYVWGALVLVVGGLVGWARWNMRWHKGNNEGVALMAQGRATEALARFKDAQSKTRNLLPVLNAGVASLHLWKLSDAARAFESAAASKAKNDPLRPNAQLSLALTYALLGRLDDASRQLSALAAPKRDDAVSRLAEVVVAARSGDLPRARALCEQHLLVLDQLGGPLRALADAVRAFISAQLGGPSAAVDRVRLYREASADGLAQGWPELVAYVDRSPAA